MGERGCERSRAFELFRERNRDKESPSCVRGSSAF